MTHTDTTPALAAQLGAWAADDPQMRATARHICGAVVSHMPAGLTDDQEVAFLAALVGDLMGRIHEVAKCVAEQEGREPRCAPERPPTGSDEPYATRTDRSPDAWPRYGHGALRGRGGPDRSGDGGRGTSGFDHGSHLAGSRAFRRKNFPPPPRLRHRNAPARRFPVRRTDPEGNTTQAVAPPGVIDMSKNVALVEGAVDRLVTSIGHVVADLQPTERTQALIDASARLGRMAMAAFDEIGEELAEVIAFEAAGGE
ncbi:hypothetical protein ABZ468_42910 [Streptomyces sp. NPDC005708]|uniref:hypothetical protein n=1 Tax=Streptomyces sp. NPDC005708 TaxID=3154564 RepID=UPI0033F1085B